MTFTEIKSTINSQQRTALVTLMFVRQFTTELYDENNPAHEGLVPDENGMVKIPQRWVSHWENASRIRVTMHEDVMANVKEDTSRNDLALKYELVPAKGDRLSYSRYIVILPTSVEIAI